MPILSLQVLAVYVIKEGSSAWNGKITPPFAKRGSVDGCKLICKGAFGSPGSSREEMRGRFASVIGR